MHNQIGSNWMTMKPLEKNSLRWPWRIIREMENGSPRDCREKLKSGKLREKKVRTDFLLIMSTQTFSRTTKGVCKRARCHEQVQAQPGAPSQSMEVANQT